MLSSLVNQTEDKALAYNLLVLLSENKLFYVGKDRKQMRLVIVSDEEKKKVLEKCHKNATGTHHGISRTLTLVESNYYWTSVTNDVKQWVWLHSYRILYVVCYKCLVILWILVQQVPRLFHKKEM